MPPQPPDPNPTEDPWDVVGQESHLMDAQPTNQETASMIKGSKFLQHLVESTDGPTWY